MDDAGRACGRPCDELREACAAIPPGACPCEPERYAIAPGRPAACRAELRCAADAHDADARAGCATAAACAACGLREMPPFCHCGAPRLAP